MTREECEKLIIEKMKEILEIYHKYCPDGDYLDCSYCMDTISVNNNYWENEMKLQYCEDMSND